MGYEVKKLDLKLSLGSMINLSEKKKIDVKKSRKAAVHAE